MVPLEILVKEAIDIVKLNLEPVQFQHRYRMPEGDQWSKWSGWKNGGIPRNTIVGWQYEARGLYAL